MGSVFMPVDKCTRENSCLQVGTHGKGYVDDDKDGDDNVDGDYHDWQVLAGSHLMGRVDHFLMGEQSGADPERVRLTRINHYDNFNSIKKNRCHLIKQLFRWRWPRSLVASTSLWRWTLGMPSSSTPTFFTPGVCMKKEIHHQSFNNTFSDQNKSDLRRWVMISSYNQVTKCPCQSQKSIDVTFLGS